MCLDLLYLIVRRQRGSSSDVKPNFQRRKHKRNRRDPHGWTHGGVWCFCLICGKKDKQHSTMISWLRSEGGGWRWSVDRVATGAGLVSTLISILDSCLAPSKVYTYSASCPRLRSRGCLWSMEAVFDKLLSFAGRSVNVHSRPKPNLLLNSEEKLSFVSVSPSRAEKQAEKYTHPLPSGRAP